MKDKENKFRVSFAISKELWKQYGQACKQANIGRSQYLRTSIQNLVDDKKISFFDSLPKSVIKKFMKELEKGSIMSEDK